MTEPQLKALGFQFIKQYHHDQWTTNRYRKGVMEVEFTYEAHGTDKQKLVTLDLTIDEVNYIPITLEEMKALTPILGKEL